jgi:hypothetical protein
MGQFDKGIQPVGIIKPYRNRELAFIEKGYGGQTLSFFNERSQ